MSGNFSEKFDLVTLFLTLCILSIGLVAIYSATYSNETASELFNKQLIFSIAGIIIMILINFLPPKHLAKISYIIYFLSILSLILVLLIGKKISGSRSWFSFMGFGIQPSEFAKIATVLAVSAFLSSEEKVRSVNKPLDFLKACIFVIIPVALIMKQPDMGTSLVFISMTIPIFFWAGLSPFFLFSIISPFIIIALTFLGNIYLYVSLAVVIIILFIFKKKLWLSLIVFLINLIAGFSAGFIFEKLEPYQKKRILSVLDPSTDPLGSGYNAIQSLVAIGSGGFWGKGFLQGTQTQLKFIPEQWTDFIFCMIGEEFGFIGAALLIILILFLLIKLINNAYNTKSQFFGLVSVGFAGIFFIHFIINIGMTIGLMPIIGIPLPLVSYGISSLLSFLIMIGISMNTYRNRKVYI